jgi:hypothetical protein
MVGKRQENSCAHDVCMCVREDNNVYDVLVYGWENNNMIFLCACVCDVLMCMQEDNTCSCVHCNVFYDPPS